MKILLLLHYDQKSHRVYNTYEHPKNYNYVKTIGLITH